MIKTLNSPTRFLSVFILFCLACCFCGCSSDKSTDQLTQPSQNQEDSVDQKTANSTENQKSSKESVDAPVQLHVSRTELLNDQNEPVVLQGFSTFGINYMPDTVNQKMFQFLKDEMGSEIIRLALYPVTDNGTGYCNGGDQEELRDLVKNGVGYATESGQYSIIDWHVLTDGNPNDHLDEAKDFFDQMSAEFKDNCGVLYEVCNEPNGNVTWQDVKSYAEEVIPVIRKNAPDAIILVGTPNWDQDEDEVVQSQIENESNIMYTVHFYAATHKQDMRDQVKEAHDKGLPMFVSEFGISEASGNGALDEESGDKWIELLNEFKISRVAWAISNKDESSAIFVPGTDLENPSLNDLSEYGRWLRKTYTGKKTVPDASDQNENDNSSSAPAVQASNNLKPDLQETNSWTADGAEYRQYTLTLTNTGQSDVSGWSVSLDFGQDVSISDSWNGEMKVNGTVVSISPASWNQNIKAGESVSDIGLIVVMK